MKTEFTFNGVSAEQMVAAYSSAWEALLTARCALNNTIPHATLYDFDGKGRVFYAENEEPHKKRIRALDRIMREMTILQSHAESWR